MELSNGKGLHELFQAHTLVLNHAFSTVGSMSLRCAVELGLADIIHEHGKPMTLSILARSIPVPPEKVPMLGRLMRLLVSKGAFAFAAPDGEGEGTEPTYTLTPFSTLLLKKGANISAHVMAPTTQALVKPLFHLGAWFKLEAASQLTPFRLAHDGLQFWELMNERSELNDMFNEAMASSALWVMKAVVTEYPGVFQGLKSLVDVGGGIGTSAKVIAETFPGLGCIVFDLPHVVAGLQPETEGIDVVAGDMFAAVPPAIAAFLKSILHDWGDEDCVKILKKCKEAIPPGEEGGKVIIVDIVVNSQPNNHVVTETQLYYDVSMMLGFGGKEREEHEWKRLFNDAGFGDYKIFPMPGIHSLIEVYP